VIIGLLGTVFLRKTFLSWRTNSEIILNKLSLMDIEITTLQAKTLAKAIRAQMWEWHIILGYVLVFLIIYRIYLYFKDTSQKDSFWHLNAHKKMVFLLHCIFYATIFFMCISGFAIYFYEALNFTKEFAHDLKELHEIAYNFFIIFIPLHIIGVVFAENTKEHGIISSMISGRYYG
jgi:cytochrome b561